jgi:NADH:ubiquinone oxidoreductase subunit E
MSTNAGPFQEALEIVESLPDYQQDDLIEIIRKRRLDRRREALLENIKEAQAEYARGECRTGTVEDLMREIDE